MPKKEKKVDRDDNQGSSTTNRMELVRLKQKEKYSIPIQNQENWEDESNANHDSNDRISRKDGIVDCVVPIQNLTNDENLETNVQVRAFAVAGSSTFLPSHGCITLCMIFILAPFNHVECHFTITSPYING